MLKSRTITTTTTVAGFSFRVDVRGASGSATAPTVRISVQHFDANGLPVRLPRVTPQTVTRPHRPGHALPPRPTDENLAAVLAMPQFAGLPALLAQAAAAYEALEYPVAPTAEAKP